MGHEQRRAELFTLMVESCLRTKCQVGRSPKYNSKNNSGDIFFCFVNVVVLVQRRDQAVVTLVM